MLAHQDLAQLDDTAMLSLWSAPNSLFMVAKSTASSWATSGLLISIHVSVFAFPAS
jgi:hypothetical protein